MSTTATPGRSVRRDRALRFAGHHRAWFSEATTGPANHERAIDNARLTVSQIVVCSFKDLKMAYPKSGGARDHELLGILEQLTG
jgi:hypothetical protein